MPQNGDNVRFCLGPQNVDAAKHCLAPQKSDTAWEVIMRGDVH